MLTEYFVQNLTELTQKIQTHGIALMDDFLPADAISALGHEIQSLADLAQLKAAGTGRENRTVNQALRGDHIYWLETDTVTPVQALYFQRMEAVRQAFNQQLFLGLHSLECHLALYKPGMRYQKHIDRFKGEHQAQPQRQVSCILYLNKDWQAHHGGQLRIYTPQEEETLEKANLGQTAFFDILPIAGLAVFFLSDTFYHEVLAADRDRMSLTGWFLTR
jgi:SM-20-related protein